jgi:NTE family protein
VGRPARARALALAAAAGLAAGGIACRHAAPPLPPEELSAPQAPHGGPGPRVALVLGGGAARGFAHVGVLAVLEEARVPVDLIVGTSVGSLVGAIYADGKNRFELERLTRDLERSDFFDFGLGAALFGTGLATGERVERFVRTHVAAARIEDLRIRFVAIATDLDTGEVVLLDRGDVARAVRASSAIPGVFEPVIIDGRTLVDGGVVENLPVHAARLLGVDVVIAVDVTALSGSAKPKNFVEVILRSVNILTNGEVAEAAREADVVLSPQVGALGLMDFDEAAKTAGIAAGEAAARAAMPRIRDAIDRWRARRGAGR